MITSILLAAILLVSLLVLYFSYKASINSNSSDLQDLRFKLDQLRTNVERVEGSVKSEIATNREENLRTSGSERDERTRTLTAFGEMMAKNLHHLTLSVDQKMDSLSSRTTTRMDQMRETIERKISELQTGNERKLDEMRATVDEKLQKTLETRLGESFRLVSERLEAVHKGLGDMQQLATGVGDLKRVLTNVKSRGVLGEYQLQNILEQLFTPDQYSKNVKTKTGSTAMVEFALKLPGKDAGPVWLPIDSKFPKEDYELLTEAYDSGNPDYIEECRRNFVRGIRKCANDISSKYIDPPATTDFAILFLPFESLYAEVLRTPGLFETIQRECRINIAGPTTLSAFLSSMQMGFRTLAIEKRSSEVWELLGAVKTEFGNFGAVLEKTQKKLMDASNVIDSARIRSRAIERKLKSVEALPAQADLLPDETDADDTGISLIEA